jgi:endothelin-converting enzyme/putative endopeptidase
MTKQIEQAMRDERVNLDWMSAATKEKALEKLRTIVNKIGYPDQWRDYGPVEVRRDDFFGNVARASLFESRRNLAKIGKPVDRGEWRMTPPTVNAYYNPQTKHINFAAGVLQPPLYDPKMDDAPNYGNTGGTIGHELTHGFDDEGRHFDAQGNLKDWWTEDASVLDRAQCIVDQYRYTIVDDIKINSKLTEARTSPTWAASCSPGSPGSRDRGRQPGSRDGFTPEQRFFVSLRAVGLRAPPPGGCARAGPTDAHSPGKPRQRRW